MDISLWGPENKDFATRVSSWRATIPAEVNLAPRRRPTRRHGLAVLACASLCTALAVPSSGQQTYDQVDWPLPATSEAGTAAPWHFGEVAAVSTTREGTVLVLHRGAHPILEFDVDGNFVGSWGEGGISGGKVTQVPPPGRTAAGSRYTVVHGPAACFACGGHSIRTDPDGNVWVVDAAAHIVYRFDQDRNIALQLGESGVPGTDRDHFHLPTDVAFGPNGEIYVPRGRKLAARELAEFKKERTRIDELLRRSPVNTQVASIEQ